MKNTLQILKKDLAQVSLITSAILASSTLSGSAEQTQKITPFAANVTRHVLLHELGHAVIREFDVPVLANEETMADSFATSILTQFRYNDAVEITSARIRSWMIEDSEVKPDDYDMMGEHDLDIRRAYQVACLVYGADPAEWGTDLSWIGFSQRDAADCSDTAPDQIDGWMNVIRPHLLGEGNNSDNVKVIYGEGPMNSAMQDVDVVEEIAEMARKLDWPQPITFHFDHCDRGASWSRTERRILLCDDLVMRFVAQGMTSN